MWSVDNLLSASTGMMYALRVLGCVVTAKMRAILVQQETQLSLTNRATRLEASQGHTDMCEGLGFGVLLVLMMWLLTH